MTQRIADEDIRLSPPAVALFLLLNLVPLIAMLPAVKAWSGGTLPSYALLPVVVLPTVVLATHSSSRTYRIQLGLAVAMCAVSVIVDAQSTSLLVAGAISTIGTLIFTTVLIERSRRALRTLWEGLHLSSVTDPLTGALNRRGAVARLADVTAAATAAGQDVALAAIDLDHFKRVNDEYGHAAGDDVLRSVCDDACDVVGAAGLVIRSGGEELVLLAVGDPVVMAETLMSRLARSSREPRITISAGVVRADPAVLRSGDDLWAAVDLADRALYQAKATGRDRVIDGGVFTGVHPLQAAVSRDGLEPSGVDPGALPGTDPDEPSGVDPDASGGEETVQPQHLFQGLWAAGTPAWRRAIDRARQRQVDPAAHRLYRVIVGWTMVVGMITTIQQMVSGSMPAVQGWVALPVGWLFGGTIIVVMGRLQTAWALTPVFVGGSLFELFVVFGVGFESRPAALMLSLLVGLLVVLYWPHWPMLGQAAVTVIACIGAALAPDRPAEVTLTVAAVTAVSLVLALAMVAAQRRREEAAEEELRWRVLTDPLTGLGNRRALHLAAERWPSGYIAMIDINAFKALNDRYGHGRGDAVLRALAIDLHAVAGDLDPDGRVFRIGGDEFVIAGPGALPADMESRIESALRGVPVSVSAGSAEWGRGGARGLWEGLAVADRQMFGRKRARQV